MSIPHELFAFSTETVRLILIHCHLPLRRQTSDRPRFSPSCVRSHISGALFPKTSVFPKLRMMAFHSAKVHTTIHLDRPSQSLLVIVVPIANVRLYNIALCHPLLSLPINECFRILYNSETFIVKLLVKASPVNRRRRSTLSIRQLIITPVAFIHGTVSSGPASL